jgi:hypothetical protein
MLGMAPLTAIALAASMVTAPNVDATPAWRGLVVVLVSPTDDEVTRNALARITGELAAAPFQTITVSLDPARDVLSQVETAGDQSSATAAFAIVRDPESVSAGVTMWVSSRATGTTTIRRMPVQDGQVDRAATRLAIESVELLRATLAGLWPSAPVAAATQTVAAIGGAPPGPSLSLTFSVGRTTELGDAPGFWAPQIAASWGRPDRIGARLTASGFGPSAEVSSELGSARVTRGLLSLGLVRWWRADHVVQPMVGIGAGVQYVAAHGTSPSWLARDPSAFSALATVTAGVAVALSPRFAAVAAADVALFWPATTVRIGDAGAAAFDRPSLFTHLGLRATF